MKKILLLVMITLLFAGCSSVDKPFEQAIKEVYGEIIIPTNGEDGVLYEMPYKNAPKSPSDIKDDALKLKDKIDRITQSVGTKESDMFLNENDLVVIYSWETPNLRVKLTATNSFLDDNNNIQLLVKTK